MTAPMPSEDARPAGPAGAAPFPSSAQPRRRKTDMAGDAPNGDKLFVWFFLGLLGFALYLMYTVLSPFVHSIILACVLTALCHPLYIRLLRLTGGRPVPAALLVLLGMIFLVVIPICIFVIGLIPQASQSITTINQWLSGAHLGETIANHVNPLLLKLEELFPGIDVSSINVRDNMITAVRNGGQFMLGSLTGIIGNTVLITGHFLLILLIMFFLLIDSGALVRRLEYLFPLKPGQTMVLIESLRRMSRAVLAGGFAVAALQGLAGGIGFALAGIPALFWGTVMAFAALVPVVGTGLVWVPAVTVLCIMEQWGTALFLTVWCGVGVTGIDSFLRPYLMRGGANVPVLFIFLSILGGVQVFGMLGLLYGPMILGLMAVMLEIYSEEYHAILQSRMLRKSECPVSEISETASESSEK